MTKSPVFYLTLLGLSLTSCASKENWRHSHITSGTTDFNSSRLVYTTENSSEKINLELIQTKNALRGYLSVHSHPILPYDKDPKKALISITIENDSFYCIGQRHEGGHRILLPEETLQLLIAALREGKSTLIETSGYKTKINPEGFPTHYLQFKKRSTIEKLINHTSFGFP